MKVQKESRLFFAPSVDKELGLYTLGVDESHHLVKVLRKSEGETLQITNGRGVLAEGVITELSKKSVVFELNKIITDSPQQDLPTIAISPTKNIDRFEWFLEKATEIGVGKIIPILCENSERKVLKTERLIKKVVGAMKQSGRLWLPKLEEIQKFDEVVKSECNLEKFIAHCHEGEKLQSSSMKKLKNSIILIGPEGGFSPVEVQLAKENQFQALSLGEYRLRSETAGIIACQILG